MRNDEFWTVIQQSDTAVVWVEIYSSDTVVVTKPDGYGFWKVYDSSDRAIEGFSLGPFHDIEAAIQRIQEDIPAVELPADFERQYADSDQDGDQQMSDPEPVLEDLLAVLYRVQNTDIRDGEVGVGKKEIHPLAYHLQYQTDGGIFDDVSFKLAYRGVRSPEIRRILSYFESGEDREVLDDEDPRVEHSDVYFRVTLEEDEDIARGRIDDLDEDTIEVIDRALHNLNDDWLEFVRSENRKMNERIELAKSGNLPEQQEDD